jgi:hypothetical protein
MNKQERARTEAEFVQQYVNNRARSLLEGGEVKVERKTANEMAMRELFLRREEKLAEKFSRRTWIPTYKGKKTKYVERHLNLLLSDLHYGANLDSRLVQYPYLADDESQRTASIVVQTADYKRQYRKETVLNVHILGDILQGKLHDVQNGAALTEQIDRALHHLVHALEFLATEFRMVYVRTSVGNHGRDTARHGDRVLQDKWDSNEFRLYRAIKWALKKVPNIKMETPMRSFYVIEQFGMKSMYTHGDTVLQPGYPGKSINIGKLKHQANEFCLSNPEYKDTQLFAVGHVHTSSSTLVGSTNIVTNGCLLPGDEFAQSIGIFGSNCNQWLWETVDGHIFGDSRRLSVNETPKDSELTKVIPIWEGLEA